MDRENGSCQDIELAILLFLKISLYNKDKSKINPADYKHERSMVKLEGFRNNKL